MAEVASRAAEKLAFRRAVQVDIVRIREHELHQPQRVNASWFLPDVQLSRGQLLDRVSVNRIRNFDRALLVYHFILMLAYVSSILLQGGDDFFQDDAVRHLPV